MNYVAIVPSVIESFNQPNIAIVEETITKDKRGRVKFMGTYWFARFLDTSYDDEALLNTIVKVVGREGLTLIVIPSK